MGRYRWLFVSTEHSLLHLFSSQGLWMLRQTESPANILMPCLLLWLSEGLRAHLIPIFVWGHLPFSSPFRNRVSLSVVPLAKGPYLGRLMVTGCAGHRTRPFALNLWKVSGCPTYRVKFSSHIHLEVGEKRESTQPSLLHFLLVPSDHSSSSSYRERAVPSLGKASSNLSC